LPCDVNFNDLPPEPPAVSSIETVVVNGPHFDDGSGLSTDSYSHALLDNGGIY
jgi:hypothetical protein